DFFASGRSVPWWLAGLSMVATTFSSDTPNLVTDIVRTSGVAGNWVWWAFVLTGMATVFFNAIIMATVNLAACKIAAVLFGLERWQTLLLVGSVNVVFAAYAGLWGV